MSVEPVLKSSNPRSALVRTVTDHPWRDLLALVTRHRQLTWEMTKREVAEKHTGQMLGASWALLHPLVMIGIYVFVFAFVFQAKIGGTHELPLDYTTYLLSGLIPWLALQEALNKGSQSILNNASLVKQVVFPVEILPVKSVLATLPSHLIGTTILAGYVLVKHGSLPWTWALLPLLIVLQLAGTIGICFVLAPVGAYFRDLVELVRVFSFAGMYVMPIFYLPHWVPGPLQPLLYLNPFSYMAWAYQDACYFGRFEHPWAWAVVAALSAFSLGGGYLVFRRLKSMLGNVL